MFLHDLEDTSDVMVKKVCICFHAYSKKTKIEDSYSYSGKAIESKLLNKITNKYKKTSQEKIDTGTPLNELETRLFLIKP